MTTELFWLTLTTLMTALFWIPYILDRVMVRGLIPAISGTGVEEVGDQSLWARRAVAAHRNAVENLVIFAPAVLVLHALGVSTGLTQAAAAIYFFARLAHFVVYTMGVPFLRTPCFSVGWLAQLAILFVAIGHL